MKKIAFGKQQGNYHKAKSIPCQDYVNGYSSDGICVIALADGAGSYEKSGEAARIVVDAVIKDFAVNFDFWYSLESETFKTELISHCRNAVEIMSPDTCAACTLLVCASSDDDRTIIAHIGDGYIFGKRFDDEVQVISFPENGSEPNETFFVSDANAKDHLRVLRDGVSGYSGVMLCSDGASAALIDRTTDRYSTAIWKLITTVQMADETAAAGIINDTIDSVFRVYSQDDMSIGIMAEAYQQSK